MSVIGGTYRAMGTMLTVLAGAALAFRISEVRDATAGAQLTAAVLSQYEMVRDVLFNLIALPLAALINSLHGWLPWLAPWPWFDLLPIQRDALILYLLVGGSLNRLRLKHYQIDDGDWAKNTDSVLALAYSEPFADVVRYFARDWINWFVLLRVVATSMLLWPFKLVQYSLIDIWAKGLPKKPWARAFATRMSKSITVSDYQAGYRLAGRAILRDWFWIALQAAVGIGAFLLLAVGEDLLRS